MTKRNNINAHRVFRMCVNGGGWCSFFTIRYDANPHSIRMQCSHSWKKDSTEFSAIEWWRRRKRHDKEWQEAKLQPLQQLQKTTVKKNKNKSCSRISIVCALVLNSFAKTPKWIANDWNSLFLWNVRFPSLYTHEQNENKILLKFGIKISDRAHSYNHLHCVAAHMWIECKMYAQIEMVCIIFEIHITTAACIYLLLKLFSRPIQSIRVDLLDLKYQIVQSIA